MAVDPGGTTGWCLLRAGETIPETFQHTPYEFEKKAHEIFQRPDARNAILIVERFTITAATAKKSQQPEALEIIGTLKYLAKFYAKLTPNFQSPADVMRLVTDQRLKALGWYRPGIPHGMDSLRHLAAALARRGELRLPT